MQTYNQIYGEYLGYPQCCIKAFGDVAIPYFMRPQIVQENTFNGFVPCIAHCEMAYRDKQGLIALINQNRKCSVPFSEMVSFEDDLQIQVELNKL